MIRTAGPPRLEWAALLAFLVVAGLATWFHEPWRDEAQAWLIARDLDLWVLVTRQTGHEASPALWHVLNAPLARLELPYATQRALNLAFAVGAAALLLWRAPLPAWLRVGAVASYFLVYEYGAVARSYALGIFLLCAALTLHGARRRRPLAYGLAIALLANANVYGLLLGFGLGLSWLGGALSREALARAAPGLLLAIAGGAAALLQILPPEDNWRHAGGENAGLINRVTPTAPALTLVRALFPLPDFAIPEAAAVKWALAVGAAAIWGVLTLRLFWSPRALAVFAPLAIGILFIDGFERDVELRGAGHLLYGYLGALWIARELGEEPGRHAGATSTALRVREATSLCLAVSLGLSAVIGLAAVTRDVALPFSGAADMARHIRENGLADRAIVAFRAPQTSSVLPYFPSKKLWRPELGGYGSFVTWDAAWSAAQDGFDVEDAPLSNGPPDALFLFHRPYRGDALRLLHASPGPIASEDLYLYERRQ